MVDNTPENRVILADTVISDWDIHALQRYSTMHLREEYRKTEELFQDDWIENIGESKNEE